MTNLYQQTVGSGQPLALVHGWAMHSGVWRGFAQRLAGRYQVTCLDLPGHGRSEKCAPFTLENAAEALAGSYQEPASWWLGWSLGASVVLELARRYPERVAGLVLVAANPRFVETDGWPGVKAKVLEQFAEALADKGAATLTRFLALQVNGLPDGKQQLKILTAAIAECTPPDQETLQDGLKILKNADLRPVLTVISQPVLVISGTHDTLVPTAAVAQIAALSARIQTHVLERAGHVPFLSHGPAMQAAIARFMTDLSTGNARENQD